LKTLLVFLALSSLAHPQDFPVNPHADEVAPVVVEPSVEPRIVGPERVGPHRLARFGVTGDFREARWLVLPSGSHSGEADGVEVDPSGGRYAFSAPPGKYSVISFVVTPTGGARILQASVTFDGSAPTPNPPPVEPPRPVEPRPPPVDPTPVPAPPAPTPEFGPVKSVMFLYESGSATGREPFYDAVLRLYLNASSIPWRAWDKDLDGSREPEWAKRRATAGSGPIPGLYLFDAAGRVKSLPLPSSSEATIEAIQKHGGPR
jgi:hypothetical protein